MKYLASTFSPSMLFPGGTAFVSEIDFNEIPDDVKPVIGHENTAKLISVMLGREVKHNRENIVLMPGDVLYCVIPQFRPQSTREFGQDEIENVEFRSFMVTIA